MRTAFFAATAALLCLIFAAAMPSRSNPPVEDCYCLAGTFAPSVNIICPGGQTQGVVAEALSDAECDDSCLDDGDTCKWKVEFYVGWPAAAPGAGPFVANPPGVPSVKKQHGGVWWDAVNVVAWIAEPCGAAWEYESVCTNAAGVVLATIAFSGRCNSCWPSGGF